MDIEFSCSKCGQRLVVDEKYTGTSVDCPKCQDNLPVPYKFQCSECSFKSYRDFPKCPRCRSIGPGPLGDKVRKKRKWMRRLSFSSIALIGVYFLLVFAVNQVVRAKKVRIEKKLTIAKELIVKGKDLKAWEELEEIQATAHKLRFKEEEIKQIMKALGPEVEEIRRQKRIAEEKHKAEEEARQFEEQQRAKGLIKHEGKWMSPAQIKEAEGFIKVGTEWVKLIKITNGGHFGGE